MTITRVYLGNPAGTFGMQAIPAIRIGQPIGGSYGMSPVFGRGTISQTLIGGGTAVQRLIDVKSGYSIQWGIKGPADIDLLMSFFDGGQGAGPYCLVDPSQQNWLPANVARMGAVKGSLPEWSPTVGALAASTVAGPTGLLSGVAAWTGSANSSILYMGLNNVIDGTWLPPIVNGLSHRFDIWAKVSAGSASLTASFLDGAAGATPASFGSSSALVLGSTWQLLTIRAPSSTSWTSTQDYAMLKLAVSSATTPTIQLAAPSFVYSTEANASAASPWAGGVGVPRCVITGDAPSPVGRPGLRDFTMTLAESA